MATYNKDILPATPRNIHLANSKEMKTAVKKMEEIRDFFFEGCELLFEPLPMDDNRYVMFNIMNGGKLVQSYLWDEKTSLDDKVCYGFHDWTKIMEKYEAEKPKKVKKGKKNRSKK
jgi:hypothetical protein